jgi:hypothetical protein
VDPAALTARSAVEIVAASSGQMNFLKDIYLAKAIAHTSGIANFLVLIDGGLAGGFIYARHRSGGDAIYLLSDFALAPKSWLSKLIAMLATSHTVTEKERGQQIIQSITSIGFGAGLIVPSLDYRMHWSRVPLSVVVAGDLLVAVGFSSYFLCIERTALRRRLSSSRPIRRLYRLGHTHWCAIQCISVGSSCSWESHSRLARGGGCSSSHLWCLQSFGDYSVRRSSSKTT